MKTTLLRIAAITIGATFLTSNVKAETYTSTCDGDIEDGATWGVDPETFQLNEDDELIINHELNIGTKYLAPDVNVGNLLINPEGKLLIKFSGDDYSTVRGLNVHGNLVNHGCLGFDRLGSFSNGHDEAVAGGYGRLWLSLWGNLENYGIINTNCLFMKGENQTILSTEKIQITEFSPKYAKGNITALSDITLYNTSLTFWAGSVEDSEFNALDMNGHTLTLTADAPTEPSVWWYSPGWNGNMSDMKVLFGSEGKLVVNDCYVSENVFYGDNITVASDSHGFFKGHNVFNGNVDMAYGNLHITCTTWIEAFEVIGNLVNHASVNSAEIVYPGKGVDGSDYHMLFVGDSGLTPRGDLLVNGSFENLGSFGLGYIYDPEHDAHTTLRMCTLGGDIAIKGEITAELAMTQVHPSDDYHGTYNTYDGQPLDKKGSISVKDYLKVNHFPSYLETTLVIPEGATFCNNADPQLAPIAVYNGHLSDERGLWNGAIKNRGTLICSYTEPRYDNMINAQHIDFSGWSLWILDENSDSWQAEDRDNYTLDITECGNPVKEGFVSRSWDVKLTGPAFNNCMHDLTLYYDDEDLNGLDENDLQIVRSSDGGQTWKQVSQEDKIVRNPEKNMVSVGRSWTTEDFIEGFGLFALASSYAAGIHNVQTDSTSATRMFDLFGREVNAQYRGIKLQQGTKVLVY